MHVEQARPVHRQPWIVQIPLIERKSSSHLKKSKMSIYLATITHRGAVPGFGISTCRPCAALGELHREQSTSVAVIMSSSRVQVAVAAPAFAYKKSKIPT